MLNVVCLKHGKKYSSDYVNRLHNMVSRHLTLPFNFFCFTEESKGLNLNIQIKPLPDNNKISGWWWKPYIFKEGHFANGDTNLFFDLDMVIVGNIDKLATYKPNEFVGLEDVGRVFRKHPQKLGSAVLKWPANQYSDIWNLIEQDNRIVSRFRGDQDWIWSLHKNNISFFPEDWIRSYKWEVRSKTELIHNGSRYVFKEIKNPILNPETSVLAFHGTPNPGDVMDPIIIDNWR
jgi:hypothetical protein